MHLWQITQLSDINKGECKCIKGALEINYSLVISTKSGIKLRSMYICPSATYSQGVFPVLVTVGTLKVTLK